MRLKIQMASFDNGRCADTAYLPHVGSSNKHFLRVSDWYVLSVHFFLIYLFFLHLEDDVGARIWLLKREWVPLILIYLCCRSGRCYTETVSALIVCVSDPSRHWALLLFVTALASFLDEWQHTARIRERKIKQKNARLRCLTDPVNQHWSSEIMFYSCHASICLCKILGHTCILCRKCPRGFWSFNAIM